MGTVPYSANRSKEAVRRSLSRRHDDCQRANGDRSRSRSSGRAGNRDGHRRSHSQATDSRRGDRLPVRQHTPGYGPHRNDRFTIHSSCD